jgi:putative SOS response-associated peptidase YedK
VASDSLANSDSVAEGSGSGHSRMASIHNSKFRMPAILKHEHIEAWLSDTPDAARAVLLPYPSDEMIAWPVSTRVNTPKNDGRDLIQPWEGEAQRSLL